MGEGPIGQAEQLWKASPRPLVVLLTAPSQGILRGSVLLLLLPFALFLSKICLETEKVCLSNPLPAQKSSTSHDMTRIFKARNGATINRSSVAFRTKPNLFGEAWEAPPGPAHLCSFRPPQGAYCSASPPNTLRSFQPLSLAKLALPACFSLTWLTFNCV